MIALSAGAAGAAIGAVLGAIAGSFLSTLILRWPEGRSAMKGRSACDQCGHVLRPWELVPLLSALWLRGKCGRCGAAISNTHFSVELGCAGIGALFMGMAPGIDGFGWALLGWVLLTLAIFDWRHFWLPDALTLPLIFLGLTLGMWTNDVALTDRVIGAAAGYGVLLALALGYRAWRGRDGLGLGDAKLLAGLGAWMGWMSLPFLLLIASVLGLLAAGVAAVRGHDVSRTTRVPLGTLLCVAPFPAWVASRVLLGG